jgi:hypothetical protein
VGTEQRSNAGARLVPGASSAGAATMRAAVQHRYGPPSVLESSEVGIPLPGPGDVLVQVGAAAVHPGDYFVMTGEPYVVRLASGGRTASLEGKTDAIRTNTPNLLDNPPSD